MGRAKYGVVYATKVRTRRKPACSRCGGDRRKSSSYDLCPDCRSILKKMGELAQWETPVRSTTVAETAEGS